MNFYSSHLLSMETLLEGGSSLQRSQELTPKLMVIMGHEPGRTFLLKPGQFQLGRESSCQFILNDPSVSRLHARLVRFENGSCTIEDLGSRNGTFINDLRIEEPTILEHGDVIRVGNVLIKFFESGTLEAEVFQRVFEMAMNDPLTETLTKSAVCAQLDLLMQNRVGNLSVIMADLDHFKQVNDQYGHVAGDYVLHDAVSCIKSSILRKNDLIGRFGGEEFLIVLPDTDLSQAAELAETARRNLADHLISYQQKTIQITSSFGVACRKDLDTVTSQSCQQILEEADRALYHAKKQGRNQVCQAS